MGDRLRILDVLEWRGDYRECNQCQSEAYWLIAERGQPDPTFRCPLHAWEALDRVQDEINGYAVVSGRRPQGLTG